MTRLWRSPWLNACARAKPIHMVPGLGAIATWAEARREKAIRKLPKAWQGFSEAKAFWANGMIQLNCGSPLVPLSPELGDGPSSARNRAPPCSPPECAAAAPRGARLPVDTVEPPALI